MSATTGVRVAAFSTNSGSYAGIGAGVWMASGGLTSDGDRIFAVTGNSNGHELVTTPRLGRSPPGTLGESVFSLLINSDGSLSVNDFFTPTDYANLDLGDRDFGTAPFSLLDSGTFSGNNVSAMGFAVGKAGKIYILNRDNLGGFRTGPGASDSTIQTITLPNAVFSAVGSSPLDGGYLYVTPVASPTYAYSFGHDASGNPLFSLAGISKEYSAGILGVGGQMVTSLNGQDKSSLVWMSDTSKYNPSCIGNS